jgi:anion-transporting  ArsA/GET3 family ATPase
MSSLNAYIQQSELEPINIHHEFYAMKIQQIANDLVSIFHTQTPEQRLSIMNSLSKTLDHLESYDQILDKQKNDNENKLKYIAEELSIAREYSMVDSLVREQVDDLTKQQNQFTRYQQSIIKMRMIINEALDHFHSLLIPNPERDISQQLLKQLKKRGNYT